MSPTYTVTMRSIWFALVLVGCTSPPVTYPEQVKALETDPGFNGRLDGDFHAVGIARHLDAFTPRGTMFFHWASFEDGKICVTWNDSLRTYDATKDTPSWYDAYARSVKIRFGAFSSLQDIPPGGVTGTRGGKLIGGSSRVEVTDADRSSSVENRGLMFVSKWCAPSPQIDSATRYIVLFATYKNPPLGPIADRLRTKKGDWGPDLFVWSIESTPASMPAGE